MEIQDCLGFGDGYYSSFNNGVHALSTSTFFLLSFKVLCMQYPEHISISGKNHGHIIANLERLRNIHSMPIKSSGWIGLGFSPTSERMSFGEDFGGISLHFWGENPSSVWTCVISLTNSLQQTTASSDFPPKKTSVLETSMTCVLIVKTSFHAKNKQCSTGETVADYDGLLPNAPTFPKLTLMVFPTTKRTPNAGTGSLFRLRSLKNGGNFGVPELHLLRSSRVTLEREPCGCNGVIVSKKMTKMV